MQQHFYLYPQSLKVQDSPLIVKPQYKYSPNELAHTFFNKIMKNWPGYRITDYRFLGGNVIELSLSR